MRASCRSPATAAVLVMAQENSSTASRAANWLDRLSIVAFAPDK
jgi:hypothetical protein